jgi:hypothetical protein
MCTSSSFDKQSIKINIKHAIESSLVIVIAIIVVSGCGIVAILILLKIHKDKNNIGKKELGIKLKNEGRLFDKT